MTDPGPSQGLQTENKAETSSAAVLDVAEKVLSQKKKNKGKKKGSRNPADLTPEFIAEQRALKQAAKEAKLQEMIANGLDPTQIDTPADLRFIKREFLTIPRDEKPDGEAKLMTVDIMTYNLLAQALIRRKLFPTSGNALKWFKRSVVLLNEMKHYNSDILCLQEVDFIQYNSYWKVELDKLGYDNKFYRDNEKNHGICIFWKRDKFSCIDACHVQFDGESTGAIVPPTLTRNVALILALQFKDSVLAQFPGATKKGLIIGTTHMFWHPFGTFARTLQTYVVLSKVAEFLQRVNVLHKTKASQWYKFFAGDFNSQPYDSPYLSITKKPVAYESRAAEVLAVSTSFQYSHLRGTGVDESKEENVELVGEGQPASPVPPEGYEITPEQYEILENVANLHNSLNWRAISVYSVAYHQVHAQNTDNDRKEPIFSNWAHAWRGLLDYIFLIKEWDPAEDCREVDSLQKFEQENDVRILQLLRLPMPAEMGPEPSGQPREGMYGSDHLCMIARIGLSL